MFVYFAIYSTKYNPSKNYKIYQKSHFSIAMGFQNENEYHCFGNLVICIWKSFEKVIEIFLKEFV